MIRKVNSAKKFDNNKNFSAIFRYGQGPRWLSYYIRTGVKLVAVLVFSDWELKDHPKGSFQLMKKIYNKGLISRRTLRKFVKMVAKECSTMAVTRKTNPKGSLSWASCVRDYADELPSTITLLAVYKGKILLKRASVIHQEGLKENSYSLRDSESELVNVEKSKLKETETYEDVLREGHKKEAPSSYISLQQREPLEQTLGWPLGRISEVRNTSVVQWVMNLPNRSNIVGNCTIKEPEIKASEDELVDGNRIHRDEKVEESSSSVSFDANESPKSRPGWPLLLISVPETLDSSTKSENANNETFLVTSRQPANELELVSIANSLDCRIFKYEELKTATSLFSSENLIGEGGCSSVYRGCLQGGKTVAVKVLKPYKEAWTDFSLEVNIVSSINHKHITPLIGICLENGLLISVYDFFHKGSLENYLHGGSGRSIMPWEVRFKVAVEVAEALNYLHNRCPQPVIHRDVKPSNILLTNELEPQLSDFGLAIWGSADCEYTVESDVVGTFGYIAPEYLMYGMISDKIDVYAFGVVLLELLSGKKPIGVNVPKGQEILVKWAKHLMEKKEYEALLDPKLEGHIDVAQMNRMVLAARLCISQSAKARPKFSQILKLLRGEKDAEMFIESHLSNRDDDDDSFLGFGCRVWPDFAVLDSDNESSSPSCEENDDLSRSSAEKTHRFKFRDFLNQRQTN